MPDPQPGIQPQLFRRLDRRFGGAEFAALSDKRGDFRVVGLKRFGNRMIRRDGDKGRPHQRVGSGCVNINRALPVASFKPQLQPARLADPVFLHHAHLGGPVFQPVQRREQLFGHRRDIEKPLGQLAPLHNGTRAPAPPRLDLFIGQHGHVDRIPVDHGLFAIDQPHFKHIKKQRLLLAVIFRVAGGEFARPVD